LKEFVSLPLSPASVNAKKVSLNHHAGKQGKIFDLGKMSGIQKWVLGRMNHRN
jgi:hypothetical protein